MWCNVYFSLYFCYFVYYVCPLVTTGKQNVLCKNCNSFCITVENLTLRNNVDWELRIEDWELRIEYVLQHYSMNNEGIYSAIAKPNMTIKTKKLSIFRNFLVPIYKTEIPYLPPICLNCKLLLHFPWAGLSIVVQK